MINSLFTLLFVAGIAFSAVSQQLPNASFETWNGTGNNEKPDNWNQLNASLPSSVAIFVPKTCHKETGAHSGTYCVKLETVNVTIQGPTNGVLTTGDLITSPPYGVEGGLPFPYRPDSLIGWYKSTPVNGDLGTIEVTLLDVNADTIGRGKFYTPAFSVSSWTRFAVAVDYYSGAVPDKAITLASSSDGFNAVVGSLIWIDDLSFVYNPLSIAEETLKNIPVYSSNRNIYVNLLGVTSDNSVLNCYSVDGKLMLSQNLQNNTVNSIYTGFSDGIYIYSIQNGNNTCTGKVSIGN